MKHVRTRAGFTIVELLVVLLTLTVLLIVAVPTIARGRSDAGVQQSISNLTVMSLAHVLYAADWAGRQVTWNPDDLGAYGGDVAVYNAAHGCHGGFDPDCHPPIIAGLGPYDSGSWVIWAYWSTASNRAMLQPICFPGGPNPGITHWGHFRIPNSRPFHDYLNGRYQDRVFYAPNDTIIVDPLEPCIDQPPEFVAYPDGCNPAWSSYCFSAAAMYHPDVWRSNGAGGWQAPWLLDHGYQSPGLFQAAYPGLKTHMLEHSWLQNSPGDCNPNFTGCEPYYFNHSIDSAPVTLFYDGSVRLLPNSEVLSGDFQILGQTGGEDGLWHRGTTFGADGYLIGDSYDYVPLSHHVLTTDGILGRDTLGGASPMPYAPPQDVPRRARALRPMAMSQGARSGSDTPFTPEDEP